MKKTIKITIIIICVLVISTTLILGIAFTILAVKTNKINDDYSYIYTSKKYSEAVKIDNIEIITQEISCGYAVIQMFSAWSGGNITEKDLLNNYGKVVTSTGNSFCKEFNKQFPEYYTKIYKYLKNSELIDKVYDTLASGIPVPFEWAAKSNGDWTLHYSLILGMDIPNDTITVANPYGFIENLSIKEFLERTTFSAFVNMPFYYHLAFAIGIFEKNTVFIPAKTI